jgi:myo-inositol 2-dehydrogenase / D-chiro-inositol 1-dehydrogenase
MHRRYFFLGTLAAALPRRSFPQSAHDVIRTGHIGTGNRGSYDLKAVLEQPNVKVVAVCDIKPDRLDKAATLAARDKPETMTDYRRLLARKDIDAVYIATPCDLHVEMAIAALEAGKHVYCEKPAGITAASVRDLVRAARAAKTVFQIGQQMRSNAGLRQTIDKIHEGAAGKIIMLKAQRHAGADLDHDGPSKDWFFNAKRSGDVIVEMAVHNLDACNWIIGSRPERAAGFGGTLLWKDDPPGRTNMDGYTLSYDYANGVKMSFTQVFFHPSGLPGGGQYFYLYTTEGAVDVSNATFYARGRKAEPVVLAERGERQRGEAHIAAFFDCIRTGRKPPADIEVAATAALTAIMGREAIYNKRVTTWQEMGVEL